MVQGWKDYLVVTSTCREAKFGSQPLVQVKQPPAPPVPGSFMASKHLATFIHVVHNKAHASTHEHIHLNKNA